jgi:hypothetical protein
VSAHTDVLSRGFGRFTESTGGEGHALLHRK